MNSSPDFQTIIFKLQTFWASRGCLIWQPYYSQVGAGTMNPATFLRVLGPEPWNVGYVEPSVRPDDGRYGENPNRLQMHTQYQVILKPDPGNPQELYLQSLEAIGIDPRQHDIRFVEDNWESPALGAWGLGWEVWLDGQEITQFTYFQQAGGMQLEPVAVEITYGLERITMALQKVRWFKDIRWNGERTYGDMNLQGEQEHSKYYFEVGDVDRLQRMYQLYEEEAKASLQAGLMLPAYDYLLKCSHTFNVLDSRGVIGVTERQAYFGRMRELARRVAEAYVQERQRQEYPWLKEETGAVAAKSSAPVLYAQPAAAELPFLFEVGTEELPAADLEAALGQLRSRIGAWLEELRLPVQGEIGVWGTPRRLVIYIPALATRQADRTSVVKGPPADRAYDSLNQPTKAAEGFARSRGVSVHDLQVAEIDGGRYVTAEVHEPGRLAAEVLAEALPALIAGIKFEKPMRWNASGVYFSRPIRWILALLGGEPLAFTYAGVSCGKVTRGLRFAAQPEVEITSPERYFEYLRGQGILLDPAERKQTIRRQVLELISGAGGEPTLDEDLLDEVTNLVEAPTALRGTFAENYLQLPAEVLVSVMKKHQRYFPIYTAGKKKLLPYFITVRNGGSDFLDVVADGNAQVILARFADATFFISEDLKRPLAEYVEKLSTLTFQLKLGSMKDKTARIRRLVESLMRTMQISEEEVDLTLRAAELCKADLATQMVVEMTSLQGVMGRYYALQSGEANEVADAILEHYYPRFTGDQAPRSTAGFLIGAADRLDTLAGLFAAGLAPTGTKDPFAQRRAALGLVQAFIARDTDFDLERGLAMAASGLPIEASAESLSACLEFVIGRLRSYLLEQGYRYDVVDAILAQQKRNPAGVARAIRQLTEWVNRADWNTILPAYARCVRITRDQPARYNVEPARFVDPAEKELYDAIVDAENATRLIGSVDDFLNRLVPMIPVINRFFEAVLVMAEDEALRHNRLGLLQRVAALAEGIADMSLLEGF